ncbi:hypothetical protein OSB04_006578 [Centaurea solstitialis]|uniref:DUF1682 family protein n=1 Tax=Centaurea solstitialis TaxID=347529 RepID=A0AA38TI64_9ASTR|nr:hypothetical protein OSB04_006578 [Centaurea solstitialis]
MANRRSPSSRFFSSLLSPRGDTLLYLIALVSIFSFFLHHISISASADSHFEGFELEEEDDDSSFLLLQSSLSDLPRRSPPPPTTLTTSSHPESHHGPPPNSNSNSNPTSPDSSDSDRDLKTSTVSSSSSFEFWDEDEFEGFPAEETVTVTPPEVAKDAKPNTPDETLTLTAEPDEITEPISLTKRIRSYSIEITCVLFLILFTVNYFIGRKENETLALAWAAKFASKDTIFDKNFSLLGVGEGDDSPLLLKEGQNVFKFYASGRRFCQGLLATMELKSRHDLISRLYNLIVPCQDEITFEVYMNEDCMDHVVFGLAKRKAAKAMQKEVVDLQRFANLMASGPNGRKWVADEFTVITESKEVAGDLITETVVDQICLLLSKWQKGSEHQQVFGEKAFEKFGKWFISMHFSDQHQSTHRKMLVVKFAIPDANHMAEMTRLVALVPYYIDLIGRYKLSSQARSKTEAARSKVAQEVYKELQNARQEALQRKKAERRKMMEEAESKLNAEALRKREAKERARQLKKAMPKIKMSRGA